MRETGTVWAGRIDVCEGSKERRGGGYSRNWIPSWWLNQEEEIAELGHGPYIVGLTHCVTLRRLF